VTLTLGKAEAVLPRSEQIPTENYKEGQRLRAFVSSVARTSRGPQIIVSRTHRTMLRRLLEVEVPEIYNGTVEIKSIAREAGYRSKVAVAALQEGVDPVGSCVGMRGTRIQNIVNELNGEKIDVVQWNPDLSYFIANSLSPAKVMNVMLHDEQGKTAVVVVPDKQLSLAIGKEGQNARLAAKLTGWRIDIKSASEAAVEAIQRAKEIEAIRERVADKMEIFALGNSILAEKEPIELMEGELNLLSEVIETVNLAQMAIERERRAEAEAARREAQAKDILAEAEAILTGQAEAEEGELGQEEVVASEAAGDEAIVAAEETPVEAGEAAEAIDEAEAVVQEVEDVMAEAEAILSEAEGEAKTEVELEGETEAEQEQTEEIEVEPETEQEPLTFETAPEGWQEDSFDLEDETREKEMEKKKARQKRRRLVYDERLGEVVAERRRKQSRRTGDWFDYEEDEE
jgi:N utilization substance protein A